MIEMKCSSHLGGQLGGGRPVDDAPKSRPTFVLGARKRAPPLPLRKAKLFQAN